MPASHKANNERSENVYSNDEVLKSCMEYFRGDELAASVWMSKYALKNKNAEFLEKTPQDMHLRMAREFARIEEFYYRKTFSIASLDARSEYGKIRTQQTEESIFHLFDHFRYVIPQGSVMAVLGNKDVIASLSNCVVLPPIYDSYGGIFRTDEQLAQLFKRRCGVGIDLSSLRPAGTYVSNAAGSGSGPVSFMERFSNTTREVSQHGRRGALMMTMDVAHPDIMEFINSKQDLTRITGANISVRISDEFMQAVSQGALFTLRWPVESRSPLVVKSVDARVLWQSLIHCAYQTAEPGILFWDRQHEYSTSSRYPGFNNISTNPCSEIAMQGGDSCRLMAMNLYHFVEAPFSHEANFNFDKFYRYSYEAQRLMDDLVDLELESVQKILDKIDSDPEPDDIKQTERGIWQLLKENGQRGRRTGLGFTALADCLAALGMKFDSDDALLFAEKMMRTKCSAEFDASIDMAIERGSFSGFDPEFEKQSSFIGMMELEFPDLFHRMMKYGRRNISLSTVAPTGTLSIMAQTSSGIEPVFMLAYKRRKKLDKQNTSLSADFTDALGDRWQEFTVHHHGLLEWMNITGSKDISLSPYHGAVASEINWKKRIAMQAIIQKYTTHSISSTLNLPQSTPAETIGDIFIAAWEAGLKGITVYREGSRQGVLIAENQTGINAQAPHLVFEHAAPSRPKKLKAAVLRFMNHDERWIAFVGILNGHPYEIFTGKEDDGLILSQEIHEGFIIKQTEPNAELASYDFQYQDAAGQIHVLKELSRAFNREYWNYAKLISGVLRHGMPLSDVVDLVSDLQLYSESINTWKSGVERVLRKFIPDGTVAKNAKCAQCGDSQGMVYEEGCLKCMNCGFSRCS